MASGIVAFLHREVLANLTLELPVSSRGISCKEQQVTNPYRVYVVGYWLEAIRGTKAKVAFYLEPGRDYRKGLQEIGDIVEDRLVQEALKAVSHVAQQPGLVPQEPEEQEPEEQEPEEEVAPAPPLSR